MDDQTANECGICLETLAAAVTLPCKHKFCADCLDGWKSKFGSTLFNKKERSKSCPLCRKKIPPSKEMISQLKYHRTQKRELEARGDTNSEIYMIHAVHIKRLEAEIGTYDGEGLDYDDGGCIEVPKFIYDAFVDNDLKSIMDWLGSPVDKKKLSARYPDFVNFTLVHLATALGYSDLMSILLQSGADVNSVDAKGWNLLIHAIEAGFDQAKILLEWGAEISFPRNILQLVQDKSVSNRDAFIRMANDNGNGNIKLANLVSSEFGGRRCEVINLPNHPQLNGKTCVVEKYITKKDKYKIIFEGSGNAALVGPNNLKRRDRTPLDCGYYITFKNGRMSRREFATKEECQAYVTSIGSSSGEDVKETAEELSSLKL